MTMTRVMTLTRLFWNVFKAMFRPAENKRKLFGSIFSLFIRFRSLNKNDFSDFRGDRRRVLEQVNMEAKEEHTKGRPFFEEKKRLLETTTRVSVHDAPFRC